MGRKYIVETGFQTVGTAAQDLLEIAVPADSVVTIHSISIDQSSDETAAEAEKLQIFLKRGIGNTGGSGGAGVTPSKNETGDAAAGAACERNNTTQAVAGGGSLATIHSFVYDVLSGFEWTPIPELRPVYSPSEMIILSIEATTDALTGNAKIIFEELGG